jgi:hypothetical protein
LDTEQKAGTGAIGEWDHSERDLANDLQQGTGSVASNGSFEDNNGTSAFLIWAEDVSNPVVGVIVGRGFPDAQSSYQSESASISGIIIILKLLCSKFRVREGSIRIGLMDTCH